MAMTDSNDGNGKYPQIRITLPPEVERRTRAFIRRKEKRVQARVTFSGEIKNALELYLNHHERLERASG